MFQNIRSSVTRCLNKELISTQSLSERSSTPQRSPRRARSVCGLCQNFRPVTSDNDIYKAQPYTFTKVYGYKTGMNSTTDGLMINSIRRYKTVARKGNLINRQHALPSKAVTYKFSESFPKRKNVLNNPNDRLTKPNKKEKGSDTQKSFYSILNERVAAHKKQTHPLPTSVKQLKKQVKENVVPLRGSNLIRDHVAELERKRELKAKIFSEELEQFTTDKKLSKGERLIVGHKSLFLTTDSKEIASNKMVKAIKSKESNKKLKHEEKTLRSLITKKESTKIKGKASVEDYFNSNTVVHEAENVKEEKAKEIKIEVGSEARKKREAAENRIVTLNLQPQIYCRMGILPRKSFLPIEPCKNIRRNKKSQSDVLITKAREKALEVFEKKSESKKTEDTGVLGTIKSFINVIKESTSKPT